MREEYWAHKGQPLPTHLIGVSRRAQQFGKFFCADGQARLAGLLHDLGKAEEEMRKRILSDDKEGEKQPHAHHGAALALAHGLWSVAFAINGHHAGLHDRSNLQKVVKHQPKAELAVTRLLDSEHWKDQLWPVTDFGRPFPDWLERLPFSTPRELAAKKRAADLYTRFLLSALVDADRLDT
jgi:CRISPR-associated endonuclease/helicase Cas3